MRAAGEKQSRGVAPQGPRLVVFDTHPIQYRSPIFRMLQALDPQFRVYFFNADFTDRAFWFRERNVSLDIGLKNELRAGFENEILQTAKLNPWAKFRLFAQTLQALRPRAVLFYGYYLPEHWILWLVCQKLRIRTVFIGETFEIGAGVRKILKRPILRLFFSKISKIVSVGSKNHRYYQKLGVAEEKLVPAKYAANTDYFRTSPEEHRQFRARIRQQLGIGASDFVLLFVGRMFFRKRPLDVWHLHERLRPQVHTIMVGTGQLENELRARSAGDDSFHMVGFKDQHGLKPYYAAADILVVPSEFETWGLVINEAFATGLPALVTNTCGAADDLVRHGVNGYIFKVGDVATAAEHIRALINDPQRRNSLGENAQNLERHAFSLAQLKDAIWLAATQ